MSELKLRLKKLRNAGVFDKVDKLVFYNPEANALDPNFTYLSNVSAEYSALVVRPHSATLYTVPMIAPRVRSSWAKVVVVESLGKTLKREARGLVGINGRFSSYTFVRALKMRPVDVSEALLKARQVKTPYEITKIRGAVQEARNTINKIHVEPGRTEAQVAADLVHAMSVRGFAPSFDTIVAAEKNSASPHHVPTQQKLKQFCYVDFGVRKDFYCSDLTIPFVFKKKFAPFVAHVAYVLEALEDEIRPGVKTADLHEKAEKLLGKYGKHFIHALGHGIGLEVHELPHISKNTKDVLEQGMTIAIEPAFYLKNRFGVRIENNYVVTKSGYKKL